MSNEILTARKGPVLEITLNRPQIGNAASDAMAVELAKLLLGAGESAEIVVLRGAGEDFCVGRETMGKRPPGAPPEAFELRRRNDVVFNCYGAFRRCEIPVIGVVRGRAFGFGCAIAAVCDITLAADTAKFQVPEMAHNIMPTMVMSALVDRVPRKAMTYLVWSTAVVSAVRAREAGIVSEVFPPRPSSTPRSRRSASRSCRRRGRHESAARITRARRSTWTSPERSNTPAAFTR
jgi:enoyl-CoA hydratase